MGGLLYRIIFVVNSTFLQKKLYSNSIFGIFIKFSRPYFCLFLPNFGKHLYVFWQLLVSKIILLIVIIRHNTLFTSQTHPRKTKKSSDQKTTRENYLYTKVIFFIKNVKNRSQFRVVNTFENLLFFENLNEKFPMTPS